MSYLQLVQNAAACLLNSKTEKYIFSLYCLLVNFRIDFMVLVLAYKSFHGLAPTYLSYLIQLNAPSGSLRSADLILLSVTKVRLKHRQDASPKLWNSLPLSVGMAPTLFGLKTSLKTHFFLRLLIQFKNCGFLLCLYLIFGVCFMTLYV